MLIYKATNKINGKCYIGKTIYTVDFRKKGHEKMSLKPNHLFHYALRKYGIDNFEWEVIAYANVQDQLNFLEEYYISVYHSYVKDPNCNGYNMTPGGDGGCTCAGKPKSEEHKAKLRQPRTEEVKKKMRKPKSNTINMGKGNIGKKLTPEHRAKFCPGMKGDDNPSRRPEVRAKLKGRVAANKGKHFNKITKKYE